MRLNEVFLGKPIHWLLWAAVVVTLYWLGSKSFHVREFVPFFIILLALAAGCVALILMTYRKGDRVTREPFEDP